MILSQEVLKLNDQPQSHPNFPMITTQPENTNSHNVSDKDIYPKSLGKYNIIDTTVDVTWNAYYDVSSPLVYEPKSKTLFFTQTNRFSPNTGDPLTGVVYIKWSQDEGKTWNKNEIFRQSEILPANMSLAVLNPLNKTNPEEFVYVVFGRLLKLNPLTKFYENQGGLYLLSDGKGFDQFEQYPEEGPITNNPDFAQAWRFAHVVSTEAKGNPYIYLHGTLLPQPNQQFGTYGFGSIEIKNGLIKDMSSLIPPAWGAFNWKSSGYFDRTWNSPMYMDVDNEGTLYAATNNFFSDELNNRLLGISKSTDNGKTWSTFERFPKAKLEEYLQLNGYSAQIMYGLSAYKSYGFAATGVDQFSFIYAAADTTLSSDRKGFFYEVFKESGQWSIREIASNSDERWRALPQVIIDTASSPTIVYDDYGENSRGFEIQLAKTADGSNLVLKYIDIRNDPAILAPAVRLVNNENFMLDSMPTTDIYYSYRPIAGGNWTAPKTVTNDVWMNKCTWIPNIVPSLNNIPIVEHITLRLTNTEDSRVQNRYPYFLQNYIVGSFIKNIVLFSSFDATKNDNITNPDIQNPLGTVGNPDPTDVNEQLMPDFELFNITPNPVSNEASLSYNLERPSNVKIELFNALGQKVKVIRDGGLVNSGYWIVNFNTEDLNLGTYYYTLTANGRAVTKIMNVIR
jgi:hypothetical protein